MNISIPIYMDYSATTPVDERVAEKMCTYLTRQGKFGNPASRSHQFGWQADEAVELRPGTLEPVLQSSIRLEHISFSYGEKAILKDVSIEIPRIRFEIFSGAELGGINKNTHHQVVSESTPRPDQGQMPFVQKTHGGNKTDLPAPRPGLIKLPPQDLCLSYCLWHYRSFPLVWETLPT